MATVHVGSVVTCTLQDNPAYEKHLLKKKNLDITSAVDSQLHEYEDVF